MTLICLDLRVTVVGECTHALRGLSQKPSQEILPFPSKAKNIIRHYFQTAEQTEQK